MDESDQKDGGVPSDGDATGQPAKTDRKTMYIVLAFGVMLALLIAFNMN
jgi:hypothetical protein